MSSLRDSYERINQPYPSSGEGQVKLNAENGVLKNIVGWEANVPQQFGYAAAIASDFSVFPTTQWPLDVFQPEVSDLVNILTGGLKENAIQGQVDLWRIIWGYKNKNTNTNVGFNFGLLNIDDDNSGFINGSTTTLPDGSTESSTIDFTSFRPTHPNPAKLQRILPEQTLLVSIADNLSITNGYRLYGVSSITDSALEIDVFSVVRTTLVKQARNVNSGLEV